MLLLVIIVVGYQAPTITKHYSPSPKLVAATTIRTRLTGWNWAELGSTQPRRFVPLCRRKPGALGFGAWQIAVFPWQFGQQEKTIPVINYKRLAPELFDPCPLLSPGICAYLRPFSKSTLKRAAETEGPGVGSRFGPLAVLVLRLLLVMPLVDPTAQRTVLIQNYW